MLKMLKPNKQSIIYCVIVHNVQLLYLLSKKCTPEEFKDVVSSALLEVKSVNTPQEILALARICYSLSIYYFSVANYRRAISYLQVYIKQVSWLGLFEVPEHKQNMKETL